MKTLLLTLTLASFILSGPAWADEAHHQGPQAQQDLEQTENSGLENSIAQTKEMREAIMAEQDSGARHDLMLQHMKKMQESMAMMEER